MRRVFSRPSYVLFSLMIAVVVFTVVAIAPSANLLWSALNDPSVTPTDLWSLVGAALLSPFTDLDPVVLIYTLALAIISAVNASLLLFYFKMYRAAPTSVTLSMNVLGVLSAILGFGCAACGTVFITALFATVGSAGLLATLPLHGLEFGYAALLLLLFSSFSLVRAINKPPVCPI